MQKPTTDIIIIGAGIAGLAAGCYAQMNGYRTRIFEMHNLPGGLCTAWARKGYIFDGCLHYLFGSSSGQPFHRMWEELGAVQGRNFINHTELMRITKPGGKTLIVYSDPARLEAHMIDLSPSDARLIKRFCQGVRDFTRFDMSLMQQKPKDLMGSADWAALGLNMAPFLGALAQWSTVSAERFGLRFKDPFLRRAVPQMFAWPEIPVMVGMFLLAYLHNQNAGFPMGASLEFARAIENRYLELGGEISYSNQVERVLVESDRAVGIRLYNNVEHYAKRLISACDGHTTHFHMLGKKYIDTQIQKLYNGILPIHSQMQVSLGVRIDLTGEPHWVTYLLDEPVVIAGEDRFEISVKNYCFDPSLAPPGKSAMSIMLTTDYNYWQRIYGRKIYDIEQLQESGILIDRVEQLYPGIKDAIEFADVATPLSYERYTGNWHGSSCGWLLTRQTMMMMLRGLRKTVPGLKNFYMAGQWVEPGGSVPVVAMSGRNIIQHICHEDRRRFMACSPDGEVTPSKYIPLKL
jgi:phytoene dehydrogenase-like protein